MPLLSTRSRLLVRRIRNNCFNLLKHYRLQLISLTSIIFILILFVFQPFHLTHETSSNTPKSASDTFNDQLLEIDNRLASSSSPVKLFIAIGSAPKNRDLRQAARETWLTWTPNKNDNEQKSIVSYKFFTDSPPSTSQDDKVWNELKEEYNEHEDIVYQPLKMGYGNNEENEYGKRAIYQMKYALEYHNDLTYYLRIDDDSFLCLHRLIYEMKSVPTSQFFWGKFWCKQGRNRADENFMLFSKDIILLLSNPYLTGKLLPFDSHVTLGWNFGYWSWVFNFTIFDDQNRLDAQQHYLTSYMHDAAYTRKRSSATIDHNNNGSFCDSYIYAHHVSDTIMKSTFKQVETRLMYKLPIRKSPLHTCQSMERSFIPRRHSKLLPNLNLQRASE